MHQPGERDLLHEGWPNGRQGDVHLRQHGERHRGERQRETARKVFQCQTGQDYFEENIDKNRKICYTYNN